MAGKRPNLNLSVKALIRDVARSLEEFSHIRASRIVVVAGEARRSSRGTVKPLAFEGSRLSDSLGRRKPKVQLYGRRMLYCITLRPLFFRDSTPDERIATLIHELFHISLRFDGTLSAARRHQVAGKEFGISLRPLVRRYLKRCPPELKAAFAYDGEVRMLQWLERPCPSYDPTTKKVRKLYTEEQLFYGVVRMLTRPRMHS